MNCQRHVPNSNDALYISPDKKWFFIEFKNGSIDRADVYRKIYDSIIMLIELGAIPDFEYSRKNINYILVYNSEKYGKNAQTQGLEENYSYFWRLAQAEEKLFKIDHFEEYLLKETHTYTIPLFEKKFVEPMEAQERLAAI